MELYEAIYKRAIEAETKLEKAKSILVQKGDDKYVQFI